MEGWVSTGTAVKVCSPCPRLHIHRRNFVCDDGDLSPPLLEVVVTVNTTFSKWNLYFLQENCIFLATRNALWPKICRKCDSGRGFAPDPAGGAHDAPPDPLVVWGAEIAWRRLANMLEIWLHTCYTYSTPPTWTLPTPRSVLAAMINHSVIKQQNRKFVVSITVGWTPAMVWAMITAP